MMWDVISECVHCLGPQIEACCVWLISQLALIWERILYLGSCMWPLILCFCDVCLPPYVHDYEVYIYPHEFIHLWHMFAMNPFSWSHLFLGLPLGLLKPSTFLLVCMNKRGKLKIRNIIIHSKVSWYINFTKLQFY